MKPTIFLLSTLALASACSTDALSPPDPASITEDDSAAADSKADGVCIKRHQSCAPGGERCCTGFCASSGYYGYGYGKGTCSAFLVDGSYCTDARQCKSKGCNNYQCGQPACGAPKSACTKSDDCCAGTSCDEQVYSLDYKTCVAAQVDGSYCQESRACQSKVCHNYQCVAACVVDAKSCASSADCCSGFCSIGYVHGSCAPAQAKGAYCQADSECTSKHCADYVCAD